jgi:hypothetical protein
MLDLHRLVSLLTPSRLGDGHRLAHTRTRFKNAPTLMRCHVVNCGVINYEARQFHASPTVLKPAWPNDLQIVSA